MNVNSISQFSCKANPTKFARQINIPMKDGSKMTITLTNNSIECIQHKGEQVLAGYGHKHPSGIHVPELLKVYDTLKDKAKEHYDFLNGFFVRLMK